MHPYFTAYLCSMQVKERTHRIREEAKRLGFSFVGIAKAEHMDAEARRLEAWLHQGMHGEMQYMENHFEKRVDPTRLVPGVSAMDEAKAERLSPPVSRQAARVLSVSR